MASTPVSCSIKDTLRANGGFFVVFVAPIDRAGHAVRRHAELKSMNAVYERVSEASRRTVVRLRPARFFGLDSVLFTALRAQNDAGPQFLIFHFSFLIFTYFHDVAKGDDLAVGKFEKLRYNIDFFQNSAPFEVGAARLFFIGQKVAHGDFLPPL